MKILEVVLKVLEVLTKATKLWESDLTPTAHLVVREIFNMQGQLSDLTKFKEGEEVELATPRCRSLHQSELSWTDT